MPEPPRADHHAAVFRSNGRTHTHGAAGASALSPRSVSPRGAARIVARERLLTQLIEARRKRCIVIQGPAGCGKTSLLVAWREALLPLGFDVAWLTLAVDDDLTQFLDYLLASVAQIDPVICREATLLSGRGMDEETVERSVIALVRGIASHPPTSCSCWTTCITSRTPEATKRCNGCWTTHRPTCTSCWCLAARCRFRSAGCAIRGFCSNWTCATCALPWPSPRSS